MIKLVSNYSFFNLLDLAKGATLAFLWGQFFYQMYKDGQLSSLEVCPENTFPLYIMYNKNTILYGGCTPNTMEAHLPCEQYIMKIYFDYVF